MKNMGCMKNEYEWTSHEYCNFLLTFLLKIESRWCICTSEVSSTNYLIAEKELPGLSKYH